MSLQCLIFPLVGLDAGNSPAAAEISQTDDGVTGLYYVYRIPLLQCLIFPLVGLDAGNSPAAAEISQTDDGVTGLYYVGYPSYSA